MRKNWRVFVILAIIASLFVTGCGGAGGEKSKEAGGESKNVEVEAKAIEEKVLEGDSAFKSVAEEYASKPSTETLEGLTKFADEQDAELTKLGVEAANLAAGAGEEAEPVDKAVGTVTEAKSLVGKLKTACQTSAKVLEAEEPDATKYLATVKGVTEAIKALEEFYAKAKEGGE